MPPKILDMSAVQNEQKALQLLANEVQNAKDDDERDMRIAEIQKSAAKLDALCKDLQAQADAIKPEIEPPASVDAVVEVVLTPEQRKRVLEATGIDVPSVRIPDPTSDLTQNMKEVQPEFIEECAMKQANIFKQLVADAEVE